MSATLTRCPLLLQVLDSAGPELSSPLRFLFSQELAFVEARHILPAMIDPVDVVRYYSIEHSIMFTSQRPHCCYKSRAQASSLVCHWIKRYFQASLSLISLFGMRGFKLILPCHCIRKRQGIFFSVGAAPLHNRLTAPLRPVLNRSVSQRYNSCLSCHNVTQKPQCSHPRLTCEKTSIFRKVYKIVACR